MPYVHTTGAVVHYLTQPACDRCPVGTPCVVFLHGGGGSAYVWNHQLPFFAASGWYAVAISLRGWGQSRLALDDPELFSSEYLAEDVVAVLDRVGAPTAAVVGHSIGGFSCARVAVEFPARVSHVVFSNTFYGLVDESDDVPFAGRWVSRYVARGRGASDLEHGPGRDDLALMVKEVLGPPDNARLSRSEIQGRSRSPTPPDNFTERFRSERPDACFAFDSTGDGNAQAAALGLKRRFKVLHAQGAVSPTKLRAHYAGPVLFAASECDSSVHWELVAVVARQCLGAVFHVWRGDLKHAPYIEDPSQFNYGLLAFLQGREMLYLPPAADGGRDVLRVVRDNVALQAEALGRISSNLATRGRAAEQILPGRFLDASAEARSHAVRNDDVRLELARAYASGGRHPPPADAPYVRAEDALLR